MKYFVIPITFILLLFSCAPDQKGDASSTDETQDDNTLAINNQANTLPETSPNTTTSYPNELTIDSEEVQAIKEVVDSLDAKLKKVSVPTEVVALNIHSKRDQLGFWQTDDGMAKITMRISSKEFEVNPSYYMKNGEILYYHHRKWEKIGDPNITEMYVCFENGKILFAEERKIAFEEGKGMPTMLMNTPFKKSTRSAEDILTEFNEYWESAPIAERVKALR